AQAAVAAGPGRGGEVRHLALEAVDGAVDQRLLEEEGGVVGEVPGREVVGAVDDQVVGLEDLERVLRVDVQAVLDDLDVGVDGLQGLGGGLRLRLANVGGAVKDLALQVAGVDLVEVDDAQGAHAGRRQVKRRRRAQTARAQQEHARVEQLALARATHLGQDQVPGVARDLVGREGPKAVLGHLNGIYPGVCGRIPEYQTGKNHGRGKRVPRRRTGDRPLQPGASRPAHLAGGDLVVAGRPPV